MQGILQEIGPLKNGFESMTTASRDLFHMHVDMRLTSEKDRLTVRDEFQRLVAQMNDQLVEGERAKLRDEGVGHDCHEGADGRALRVCQTGRAGGHAEAVVRGRKSVMTDLEAFIAIVPGVTKQAVQPVGRSRSNMVTRLAIFLAQAAELEKKVTPRHR